SLFGTVTIINHVSCFGSANGAASLTVGGGLAPYLYRLNGGTWSSAVPTLNNLTAGNYTVEIQDANSCMYIIPFEILEPSELSAIIVSQNNVNCNGGNDGTATASATGGS